MLLAGGDSFTWGNELPDCDESRYSRLSWSALLAEQHGMEYACIAEGGASNQTIARKVMDAVDNDTEMVAVMWTFPVRHELLLRQDHAIRLGKSHLNLSPWHATCTDADLVDLCIDRYSYHLIHLASHEHHEYQSMLSISALQNFLYKRNIPHVFSASTIQVYEMMDKPTALAREIRSADWFRDRIGFYDWARSNGYEMSKLGHPVAQAHKDWLNVTV
jgi:hypothetical protein